MEKQDLIKEARDRGYKRGTPIRYVPHAIDYVEGDYFEVEKGKVKAYRKPKHERVSFDDMRYDTLFDGKVWVEIADLSKRSEEQKKIDQIHGDILQ
jgi:hypothetical protein